MGSGKAGSKSNQAVDTWVKWISTDQVTKLGVASPGAF